MQSCGRDRARLVAPADKTKPIHGAAPVAGGANLATAGPGRGIYLWDLACGSVVKAFPGHAPAALSVAGDPSGRLVASYGFDARARVWDVSSGAERGVIPAGPDMAFSPDGRLLATAGLNGTITLFDTETLTPSITLSGFVGRARRMVFTPDGATLLAAARDEKIGASDGVYAWSLARPGAPRTVLGNHVDRHSGPASYGGNLVLLDAGATLVVSDFEDVLVVDVASGAVRNRFTAFPDCPVTAGLCPVSGIAASPDGKLVAAVTNSLYDPAGGSVGVWDVQSGKLVKRLSGELFASMNTVAVAWSADGTRIAVVGRDPSIAIFEWPSGAPML